MESFKPCVSDGLNFDHADKLNAWALTGQHCLAGFALTYSSIFVRIRLYNFSFFHLNVVLLCTSLIINKKSLPFSLNQSHDHSR